MSDVGQAQAGDRLSGISAGGFRAGGGVVARQLLRRKVALVGLVAFAGIILVALLAPVVAPHDPIEQDLSKSLRPPFWAGGSFENPLGTDANGRDLASRLIYGARYSLAISIGAALIGSTLGLITGLVAGYFGNWIDSVLMRLGDIQLAFPFILLAIAILGISPDRTALQLTLVMGIPGWIIYARVVRSRVLAERKKDYVSAARALGARNRRLLWRYVFPSVWQGVLVIALLDVGYLVIVESTLSFLGFGVPPPRPSWGGILAEGRQFMAVNPWLPLLPGAAILVTVLSINLLADGLGDVLDPRASIGAFRRQVLRMPSSARPESVEGVDAQTLLSVRDLRVDFPAGQHTIHAVRGVSFDVARGEILGIVGESGSGKSVTALALIQLLDPPGRVTQGEIVFEGIDLARAAHREVSELRGRRIGMIFQNPASSLNPVLTIGYQMTETITRNSRVGRDEGHRVAREALLSVGIGNPDHVLRQYPFQLSGGMNQRVMIAMSIAVRADLLIADEPTTALDVTTQAQILDQLIALNARLSTSLIFITHDIALLSEYADRILVMYAGEVCEVGPTHEVINDARHPYTRALIASIPRPDMGESDKLDAIGGELPDPRSIPKGCPFATRCPEVMEVCWEVDPDHARIGADHTAACHLWLDEPEVAAQR
jgi:peptide/nickel transport system permease protein